MGILKGEYDMAKFEPGTYSINDFLEWHERKQLVLAPKFQRRTVWKPVAKSFLIDSILRQKPLPKIFIRQITDVRLRKTIREVVDGQQRLRTILDYLNDGFKVSTVHNKECGNKYFSELPEEYQNIFLTYKFSVDTLLGVDDSEIMDIFSRLNTYSTPLNKQELINAEFYGYFKQLVYNLSYKYNSFWIENKIFTEYQIMRMNEVEMTADLMIAMLDGIQNRKKVKVYYKQYDDSFENMEEIEEKFDYVISMITRLYGETLKRTKYKKQALFYSLFLCLYHEIFGLKGFEYREGFRQINDSRIRTELDTIESLIDEEELTKEEREFVMYISKATSDMESRRIRTAFLINRMNRLMED